jgi:hypothetical protein
MAVLVIGKQVGTGDCIRATLCVPTLLIGAAILAGWI